MLRSPCVRCGHPLNMGEGMQVTVSFNATELEQMINDALDLRIRARLLCALGLIDPEREEQLR